MSTFRTWLEALETDKQKQLQKIWADTFQALGVGGLSDEDASHQSLSKITYGQRRPSEDGVNTFKGKRATYKRLENGQIFNQLLSLGDPEIAKNVEQAKAWLGQNDQKNNADTTVSTVLQKLFGPEHFEQLIDADVPHVEPKLNKAAPQPPKQDMGMDQPEPVPQDPNMDPNMGMDQGPEMPPPPPPQQPPVPPNQQRQPMQPGMPF